MKILHLCLGNFFIDNYSYQENILTKYHAKMGYDVTVIASLFTFDSHGKGMHLPAPKEYDNKDGVHIIRLAYKFPLRIYRRLRRFERLEESIAQVSPDVIFSHNISYADATVVAKYLKHHPNVKFFADNHGDYVNSAKNWMSRHVLHPIIWRHYAKILEPYLIRCYGVTPMRCRFLKEMYHIKSELVEFLPMGVDDEAIPTDRNTVRARVRTELGISNTEQVMITGGKIDFLKNTHMLIDAMNSLNKVHLHLIICGTLTPEMEHLKPIIEGNPRIHYLGWCNAERVMDCMVASDFACFPGTHSTLWEQAVGVGLPGIFKHWSEMEHVNVNDNCIFIKGEEAEELKATLTQMLDSNFYSTIQQRATIASQSFLYSYIAKKAIESDRHGT